jgi:creatinine amidohydrolase
LVELAKLTWVDGEKLFKQTDVVLLPVGATEQHGPHDPAGMDHLVAAKLSSMLDRELEFPFFPLFPLVFLSIIGISLERFGFLQPSWEST